LDKFKKTDSKQIEIPEKESNNKSVISRVSTKKNIPKTKPKDVSIQSKEKRIIKKVSEQDIGFKINP
jgi:hypothetical protein